MSVSYNRGTVSFEKLAAVLKGAAVLPLRTQSQGKLCRIAGKLRLKNKGELTLGHHVSFHGKPFPSSITVGKGARLKIGDHVFFNYGLDIGCTLDIEIGSHTIIGPMVNLIDTNFHPVDRSDQALPRPIKIGNNVWIGRGAVILPGVTVGAHSVVASGSVVTRDIPPNVLAGGAPARVIREIDVPEDWIRRFH
ncbi:DapH/DapD/GlmU-related protein [Paenibacillus sp. HB172176]|uniref:acyltransferase n=1 Tax=Paenibacillus sp. HB172176 TaxID=2493690 RepID=UPI00143CBA59|nr:DapH/DapD/GlmU-related protein [Paenibacillus sp. HB172176]